MIRKYWGQVWKTKIVWQGQERPNVRAKKERKKMITWPLKWNEISSQRGPSWVTDKIELTVWTLVLLVLILGREFLFFFFFKETFVGV